MPTDTPERLVQAALGRFYRDGFRNVGLEQVLNDVGISKTAFYKHFESKEDLMLAVLDLKNQWLQRTFLDLLKTHGGDSPVGQFRALFDVVEQLINTNDFQGCIFVKVVMEFPLPHEPAHIAAADHKRTIESIISNAAKEAGIANADALAQELCMIMEGAYITRQVTGDIGAIHIARRMADRVIEHYSQGPS